MTEKKKALVLINKTSGMGRAGNDTFTIVEKLAENGYEPIVYPIIPGTELTSEELVAKYADEVRMILCSGGDGTLNHVMNAMMALSGKKPVLAYVPAGSTNDFARGLGIPAMRSNAITSAIEGRPYAYDVGCMNGSYFNYVAAFGAFSKVSYATDQELKNVLGYAAYVISAIAELPQNIGYSCRMKITYDGHTEEGDYIFGSISNSASVGGMSLFENEVVHMDDGIMEMLLIKAPKNLAEFNAIISALATKDQNNPYITYKQVKNVSVLSKSEVEWTLDGEFGGAFKKTEVSVVNKAMTIMTGKDKRAVTK
ncbi:MAG: YegS/Rv2252/BmrU family lipid kinase [Butyrivibrio sp.]|nr:YegS/Rv2252/BmrU family lipid kinase [Butyrivibrio sp.]